jgi:hypothetical protein
MTDALRFLLPLVDTESLLIRKEQTRTRIDVTTVLDELPGDLRELCGQLMLEKRSKVLKQRNVSPRRFESSLNLIREHFQKKGINRDYKCAK